LLTFDILSKVFSSYLILNSNKPHSLTGQSPKDPELPVSLCQKDVYQTVMSLPGQGTKKLGLVEINAPKGCSLVSFAAHKEVQKGKRK